MSPCMNLAPLWRFSSLLLAPKSILSKLFFTTFLCKLLTFIVPRKKQKEKTIFVCEQRALKYFN